MTNSGDQVRGDEERVRAALPDAWKGSGGIWTNVQVWKRQMGAGWLGLNWHEAVEHDYVVAFEARAKGEQSNARNERDEPITAPSVFVPSAVQGEPQSFELVRRWSMVDILLLGLDVYEPTLVLASAYDELLKAYMDSFKPEAPGGAKVWRVFELTPAGTWWACGGDWTEDKARSFFTESCAKYPNTGFQLLEISHIEQIVAVREAGK